MGAANRGCYEANCDAVCAWLSVLQRLVGPTVALYIVQLYCCAGSCFGSGTYDVAEKPVLAMKRSLRKLRCTAGGVQVVGCMRACLALRMMSDVVLCRCWVQVDTMQSPVWFSLHAPSSDCLNRKGCMIQGGVD